MSKRTRQLPAKVREKATLYRKGRGGFAEDAKGD
jgi:hypothetical protein